MIVCPNCDTYFYGKDDEEESMILDAHLDNCREPWREDEDAYL